MTRMPELTLTSNERAFVLDAIEDALAEIETPEVAHLTSQGMVDKLLSAKEILEE